MYFLEFGFLFLLSFYCHLLPRLIYRVSLFILHVCNSFPTSFSTIASRPSMTAQFQAQVTKEKLSLQRWKALYPDLSKQDKSQPKNPPKSRSYFDTTYPILSTQMVGYGPPIEALNTHTPKKPEPMKAW